MKEILLGIIFLVVGMILVYYYLPEVIKVILGILGPMLAFLGIIFIWIGIEDKN